MKQPATRSGTDITAAGRLQYLRDAAFTYARSQGLSYDDASDCAQECVLRLLNPSPRLGSADPIRDIGGWLRGIARHDVMDFARHLAVERQHTVPLPNDGEGDPSSIEGIPDGAPTPEAALARALFWEMIVPAVDALPMKAYLCFIRHHVIRQDVETIAAAEGMTQRQVYYLLERAGRQIARWLAERGVTEEDLWTLVTVVPHASSDVTACEESDSMNIGMGAEKPPRESPIY